jgi:dUTP pyrophosphatase
MSYLKYTLKKNAFHPVRGSRYAAGLDIRSSVNVTIPAGGRGTVDTGLAVHLPHGTYGHLATRSGLCRDYGVFVAAGIIDRDYTGEIRVILINHSDADFHVKVGDRIAQLICEKIVIPDIILVDALEKTNRGDSGFGSTGVGDIVSHTPHL